MSSINRNPPALAVGRFKKEIINNGWLYNTAPHIPKMIKKGWGYELWIANFDYCGKILHVNKGKCCSMHFHINKTETFRILSGKIKLTLIHAGGEYEHTCLSQGDTIDITPGLMHQFLGLEESEIMEVSSHHEDKDSYRVSRGD